MPWFLSSILNFETNYGNEPEYKQYNNINLHTLEMHGGEDNARSKTDLKCL
jgi:hypothetical protein